MQTKARKILAVTLLLTWLFNCTSLFPMPWVTLSEYRAELEQNNLSASTDASEPDQALEEHEIDQFIEFNTEKVWLGWGLKFLILAAGILAAAMMFAGRQLWPMYVLCTSVLYMTFWIMKQNLILDPFVDGYLSYANSVLNNDGIFLILEFFLHYLVFPIFHFVLITYLLYYKPAKSGVSERF